MLISPILGHSSLSPDLELKNKGKTSNETLNLDLFFLGCSTI